MTSIVSVIDKRELAVTVFIDFTKVFDTANFGMLLTKLEKYCKFLSFINDMFHFVAESTCCIAVYPDGTNLLIKCKTYEQVYHTIALVFREWSYQNKIAGNDQRTKCIILN